HYTTAQAIYQGTNQQVETSIIVYNLGAVACAQGRYAEATGFFAESLALARRLGAQRMILVGLFGLVQAIAPGDPARAARLLGAVDALFAARNAPLDPADQ